MSQILIQNIINTNLRNTRKTIKIWLEFVQLKKHSQHLKYEYIDLFPPQLRHVPVEY